jgi:prepilin-type processing-associated H-X9-DG protein/prepilin-type N-terminal cleavage/methylation domain-containing protein
MKNPFKRAFTLIEMLVVVAIIMVLGALLFPALGKVRESGRATTCVSNLRQLQLAALNYANEGDVPYAVSTLQWDSIGATNYERKGWVAWQNGLANQTYTQTGGGGIACITNGTLYRYVRSRDIYMCPTLKAISTYANYTRGYSMATNSGASGASILSTRATTVVLFGDDSGCTISAKDSQFSTNQVGKLHGGKGNVIYLDGHVEKW